MSNSKKSGRKAALGHIQTLPGVPIFNYHGLAESISDDIPLAARPFWLSPTKFRSHLVHIRDNDCQVVLVSDLKALVRRANRSSHNVAITFDDGLMTDYKVAFPLLAEFGAKATFFLNTTTIGQEGYLDWGKIAEMQRYGMSFQSHGRRHVDLTVLPKSILDMELGESKKCLEDHLGCRVDFIAAPFGVLDRRVIDRALAADYRAVCSTRSLPARPGSTVLTRITLRREVPIGEFHGFLTGQIWPYARRLSRGLLLRPLNLTIHILGVLRHRWLKQPVAISK